MRIISDGYYYEVYDVGNGKVLKKKKTFLKIAIAIKGKSRIGLMSALYKAARHIINCEKVTKKVMEAEIPLGLLANPTFINRTDYEQDRVILLMDYFGSHTLQENKIIVDAYMDLIKELFRYKVHDNVYKFKNSYGVDKVGRVVCIDFNEMIFCKSEVLRLAKKEEWRTQAQFTKFPEGELKDYIEKMFSETLTLKVIDEYWDSHVIRV